MTDYELLTANNPAEFATLINGALAAGWSLHYGPGTFCRPCGTTVFYQAVCK